MEDLLNGVLVSDGFSLFRKAPRVVTGVAFHPNSPDYHLYFTGYEVLERGNGTFRVEDNGSVMVFKSPDRIRVSFQLLTNPGAHALRMNAWDKLAAYFFDNPSINPFLPKELMELPGLVDRLTQEKATLEMKGVAVQKTVDEPAVLNLSYTALYHSGGVMSREALVRQRVIKYENVERSVP